MQSYLLQILHTPYIFCPVFVVYGSVKLDGLLGGFILSRCMSTVRTFFMSDSRTSCFKSFQCIIPCSRGLIGKLIGKIRNQLFIATFARAHHMFLYTNPARAHPSLLNIHFNIVPTSTQIFSRTLYVHFSSPQSVTHALPMSPNLIWTPEHVS